MGWFGPSGNCGCCAATLDCGCWDEVGPNPMLVIELDIAVDAENWLSCLEGGNAYCRVSDGTYGVGLQGTISIPMKRNCIGFWSTLILDVEETYRPIEGTSQYWLRNTGNNNCTPLVYQSDVPYWIEVNKASNIVEMSAFGFQRQIYPALHCQQSHFFWWSGGPESWTPPNPTQPGTCPPPITTSERLGSYSWEIVPGA